jgi:hypothetical protein
MKQRKLVIGLLVLLAVAVSGFTFAFWAGSVTQAAEESSTVSIGQAGTSTVVLTASADQTDDLVPASVNPANSVSVLTFSVAWSEDAVDTANGTGVLTAALGTITLNGLTPAEISDMFTIEITAGNNEAITMDGASVDVEVTITFTNEPATQAIYNQVFNQNITIPVTVTVTQDIA